ncbi:NAD-glutamate dehydrogenase [Nakamurella aerolata]|uniref:NAD-glutamate dehydrogenase n=1 Tax=Nakamurella aerolata TaxID=1656892 RepID=UPI001BB15D2B
MTQQSGTADPAVLAEAEAADPSRATMIRQYFRHLADDDLPENPADVVAAINSHLRIGTQRPPGTIAIRVYNPPAAEVGVDGRSESFTVIDIVNDDMPHLVDTVVGVLINAGIRVHRVFHPILKIRRASEGQLIDCEDRLSGFGGGVVAAADSADTEEAGAAAAAAEQGANANGKAAGAVGKESWMRVLVERLTDAERAEQLQQQLDSALRSVRAVVADGPQMQARLQEIAGELRPEDAEYAELIDWFADGNMVPLGVAGGGGPALGSYRSELDDPGSDDPENDDAGSDNTGSDNAGNDGAGFDGAGSDEAGAAAAAQPQPVSLSQAVSLSQSESGSLINPALPALTLDITVGGRQAKITGVLQARGINADPSGVPVLRRLVGRTLDKLGAEPDSYTGQRVVELLGQYPRVELFWADPEQASDLVAEVLRGSGRRDLRAFVQQDPLHRFVVVLVFLAKDRWNTENRLKMQQVLLHQLRGDDIRYSALVAQSELAVVHFTVRTGQPTTINTAALSAQLTDAVRSWEDDLVTSVVGDVDLLDTAGAIARYSTAFDQAYKEDFTGADAVEDLRRLDSLAGPDDLALSISVPQDDGQVQRRLRLYVAGGTVSLSRAFPVLQSMGAEVIDERPYQVTRSDGTRCHIYDFGLTFPDVKLPETEQLEAVRPRFSEAFLASWRGDAAVDGFNTLVLAADLDWRQIAVLRAYAHYLQQIGFPYTQGYIERVLRNHPDLVRELSALFDARFDPRAAEPDTSSRVQRIEAALDEVTSLDADRILRMFLALILATDRTNAYTAAYLQPSAAGQLPPLAFKLVPSRIPGVPKPVPVHEIWVYSPRVEGVHLRFGAVARGGLRWSDRPEDFRTEILGLVKAQEVKNAVIVPVGAKGGFVVRKPPVPTGDPAADREAQLAEGVSAYRQFISALLSVTDNRVADAIVPPDDVVRHDEDDPYLVVAADKGTATFSDIANEVAQSHGFWLGDAFASGGSEGYDHKAMGITARGAWESVKHHFRDLGVDTQSQEFTAVGVGDMSGDVFGNGMLLSDQLRLVAAFDHRHIFIDPDPVAATGYAERQRLFELPRSSWADYNRELISAGGGVWPRTAKSIPISDQTRRALGLPGSVTALSPAELMRAILLAPVDLFWNGGIGTYVKASDETNAEVGDKANDPVRVNGKDLRVKVIGEGGNLGVTQRGRIEFARGGGAVNTDAIDNSAGVDTSDHEVNIKIALTPQVTDGTLSGPARRELLESMTDDVAALVLADNTAQNRLLGVSRAHAAPMMSVHRRLIGTLESTAGLDRALEFLPDDETISVREAAGEGLTSPELSVLVAYVKSAAAREMLASDLPDDPAFTGQLSEYFPERMRSEQGSAIQAHPLAKEIVTTATVNEVVNNGGISYLSRIAEETAATAVDGIRAYRVVSEIFGLPRLWADIAARDNKIPAAAQDRLLLDTRRLLDRASRWMLSRRPQPLNVSAEIDRYAGPIGTLLPLMPELVTGVERGNVERDTASYVADGVDPQLARRVAYSLYTFSLLDVVDVALETDRSVLEAAQVYYALSAHLDFDRMLSEVTALERGDRWHALARQAVRDDLYRSMRLLAADVLSTTEASQSVTEKIAQWETENASRLARSRSTLSEIAGSAAGDLAALSVAAREVRSMIR